jgi:hypothetical protein
VLVWVGPAVDTHCQAAARNLGGFIASADNSRSAGFRIRMPVFTIIVACLEDVQSSFAPFLMKKSMPDRFLRLVARECA